MGWPHVRTRKLCRFLVCSQGGRVCTGWQLSESIMVHLRERDHRPTPPWRVGAEGCPCRTPRGALTLWSSVVATARSAQPPLRRRGTVKRRPAPRRVAACPCSRRHRVQRRVRRRRQRPTHRAVTDVWTEYGMGFSLFIHTNTVMVMGYILGPSPVPPIYLTGSFGLVRPAWIKYTRSAVPQTRYFHTTTLPTLHIPMSVHV